MRYDIDADRGGGDDDDDGGADVVDDYAVVIELGFVV